MRGSTIRTNVPKPWCSWECLGMKVSKDSPLTQAHTAHHKWDENWRPAREGRSWTHYWPLYSQTSNLVQVLYLFHGSLEAFNGVDPEAQNVAVFVVLSMTKQVEQVRTKIKKWPTSMFLRLSMTMQSPNFESLMFTLFFHVTHKIGWVMTSPTYTKTTPTIWR